MFDQRDLDKFNSSQRYVERFFKHVDSVASNVDEQIELAMTMVINTFKFRKETRIAGEKDTRFFPSNINQLNTRSMVYKRNLEIQD